MVRKILIVDDDRTLCLLIKKKLEKYANTFSTMTASDGVEALALLARNGISLVVTDLQMPNMDGFSLLAHLSEHYPDIPVVVITAYGTPSIRKAALEGGAYSYIEKPFVIEDLGQKVLALLRKQSEGGTLQTVPLEMFVQLIEMEQKTCTLRIFDKATKKMGVLFFREGQLVNARLENLQGNQAAYRILAWDKVTLSIQDTCPIEETRIDGTLQAILFDAMRLKDEGQPDEAPAAPQPAQAASPNPIRPSPPAAAPASGKGGQDAPPPSPVEQVRRKIASRLGPVKGLGEISLEEARWRPLMDQAASLALRFDAGNLKAACLGLGEGVDLILLPAQEVIAVGIDPRQPRERLVKALID
jgi:CheY-like chemotaxis protein